MDKHKMTLRIFNEDYQIKTEIAENQVVRLAQLVNEKMLKIAQNQSALTPSKVAVLAALELAGELEALQADYQEVLNLVNENNEELKG
ncbi:MAG: cell division protein ZapA [Acidaminococcaceae bacterium]